MSDKSEQNTLLAGLGDEFFREFFEEAPDMFASVDAQSGLLKMCNLTVCKKLGYRREELIGRPVFDLYHDSSLPDVKKVFQEFVENGRAGHEHLLLKTSRGEPLPVALRVSSHRDVDGNILSSRSIWRDITSERRIRELELELRLQQSQKMESLAVLAGGIAHDFNNLLVGILGNASLASMELPKESPLKDKIEGIEAAALTAADLTKQLLAYAGSGSTEREVFDLSKIVEDMGHLMEVAISRKVVLHYDLADQPVYMKGDVTQVRQIIMNLLVNGSEAMGDRSGMVTIRTGLQLADQEYLNNTILGDEAEPGYFCVLEVSDTGCGISSDHRKKIFDPFFTTKSKGHGLGLAAVLGIIRSHGGTCRVYSEADNGTTFKVMLPASEFGLETETGSDRDRYPAGSGEHILVVDDEDHVRAISCQILEKFGYRATVCNDGREAVARFQEIQPDLVLMDITMPHMDGVAAFKAIRSKNALVPVVLMSGYSRIKATNALAGRAYSGFLQKPFLPEGLLQAVNQGLTSTTDR